MSAMLDQVQEPAASVTHAARWCIGAVMVLALPPWLLPSSRSPS
jgi:hypothetical protein